VNDRGRIATLAGAGLGIGMLFGTGPARALDARVFHGLNAGGSRSADLVFQGITELGSIWASVGAAAILASAGRRRAAARALVAAGSAWLLGQGMKRTFLRPRPYLVYPDGVRPLIDPPRAASWPSSHPMVLLAFVTVAGRELGMGRVGRAALSALAGGVGLTRTYVGVHYPSDVAGGLLLGRAVASVVNGTAH
jgi:undecaprenyl-diphosphatase